MWRFCIKNIMYKDRRTLIMLYQRHIVLASMKDFAETFLLFDYFCHAMRKRLKIIQFHCIGKLEIPGAIAGWGSVIRYCFEAAAQHVAVEEEWEKKCSMKTFMLWFRNQELSSSTGTRLKISRELIISTEYPNPHLVVEGKYPPLCSSILPSPEAVQSWIIILELESRSRSLTEQNSKFVIYHKFWYSRDGP